MEYVLMKVTKHRADAEGVYETHYEPVPFDRLLEWDALLPGTGRGEAVTYTKNDVCLFHSEDELLVFLADMAAYQGKSPAELSASARPIPEKDLPAVKNRWQLMSNVNFASGIDSYEVVKRRAAAYGKKKGPETGRP